MSVCDAPCGESEYLYDVFLAHAGADAAYSEELAAALEGAGVRVYLDSRFLDGASEWDHEDTALLQDAAQLDRSSAKLAQLRQRYAVVENAPEE